jgi:hypothetical protein
LGAAFAAAVMLGLVALLVWVVIDIFPSDVPTRHNPSVLDTIFDNRFVILASRVVLLSAALVLLVGGVYIVVSIVRWLQKGHLLEQAGPFKVAGRALRELGELEENVENLTSLLTEAWSENEDLERRLEERDEQLRSLYELFDQAYPRSSGGEETPS